MFYDRFVALCKQRGVAPSRAALDAGISKSLVTKWKTNHVVDPSPEVARQLAEYFNIPLHEVLGEQLVDREPREALKYALWGNCTDITDQDLEDVLQFAAFIRERKNQK